MPEFDMRENLQPAAEGYDSRLKAALKSIKNQGVHSQTEFYSRLLDAQKFGSGELYHQLAIIASKAGQHKSTAYCLRQADKSFAPYQDHGRARLYRDWALISFRDGDYEDTFTKLEHALSLHANDISHAEEAGKERDIKKGYHHLHVTQNYAAYLHAAVDPDDVLAHEALMQYGLDVSENWGFQEHLQALEFAKEQCQDHPRYAELAAKERKLKLKPIIEPLAGVFAVGMTVTGIGKDIVRKVVPLPPHRKRL